MPSMTPIESHSSSAVAASPGERIKAQPWGFLALAVAAGAGAGLLLRYKGLRKALGIYLAVRRII